jgi:hypothetical protein
MNPPSSHSQPISVKLFPYHSGHPESAGAPRCTNTGGGPTSPHHSTGRNGAGRWEALYAWAVERAATSAACMRSARCLRRLPSNPACKIGLHRKGCFPEWLNRRRTAKSSSVRCCAPSRRLLLRRQLSAVVAIPATNCGVTPSERRGLGHWTGSRWLAYRSSPSSVRLWKTCYAGASLASAPSTCRPSPG